MHFLKKNRDFWQNSFWVIVMCHLQPMSGETVNLSVGIGRILSLCCVFVNYLSYCGGRLVFLFIYSLPLFGCLSRHWASHLVVESHQCMPTAYHWYSGVAVSLWSLFVWSVCVLVPERFVWALELACLPLSLAPACYSFYFPFVLASSGVSCCLFGALILQVNA